ERPWVPTRSLWLWGLLCALVALAIPRSTVLVDALRYWLMVYVNGALAYVIGTQIVREFKQFRRLLIALAVFGVGMGLHAIFFAFTGRFLLQSELIRNWLAVRSNYLIPGTHLPRVTSFLLNPDNFGGIMEMFLPILLALGFSNATWRWRAVAFAGAGVIAIGLLFSYSTAAFVGAAAAMVVFGVLALQPRYRAYFVGLLVAAPLIAGVVFESHLDAFIEHATAPRELSLRLADWQTGLNIILHLPLTGIGIGGANYMAKEDPFRVPMQNIPLEHPHNSFLEIGAMVGLPALLVFALLLGICLWRAFQHYYRADMKQRVLIGGVIAAMVSLSVNSLATTGWTLPPASVLAWMLLGAVTSPRLLRASAAPSAPLDQASASGAPAPALPASGARTSGAIQEQT
ncbi:MAG TPA: O-antigen ligase family protein, partial [Ktedonobacterales bacterium]